MGDELFEDKAADPVQVKKADVKYTPPELALAICATLAKEYDRKIGGRGWNDPASCILEPSAGEGSFVAAIRQTWPGAWLDACEIQPGKTDLLAQKGAKTVMEMDFETLTLAQGRTGYDLIIGNPPFSVAERHIRKALSLVRTDRKVIPIRDEAGKQIDEKTEIVMVPGVLAFLLRLSILASLERHIPEYSDYEQPLFKAHPNYSMHPIVPRPSFTGDGATDMTEYGLFVWHPFGEGKTKDPVVWEKPGKRKKKGILRTVMDAVVGSKADAVEDDYF